MDDEQPAGSNERDAEFAAWLNALGFTIDAEEPARPARRSIGWQQ
jgi:hypothetical protein